MGQNKATLSLTLAFITKNGHFTFEIRRTASDPPLRVLLNTTIVLIKCEMFN